MKQPAVYILSNYKNGTLYVGVTSHLVQRVFQHKEATHYSFSARYALKKLVYFEIFEDMGHAIAREKQLKAGSRAAKIKLIVQENPLWHDLFEHLIV
jgi:putative endonuclease